MKYPFNIGDIVEFDPKYDSIGGLTNVLARDFGRRFIVKGIGAHVLKVRPLDDARRIKRNVFVFWGGFFRLCSISVEENIKDPEYEELFI